MTDTLSFTLSDGISDPQSYSITSTTVNPLSQISSTKGNWLYYLFYYNGANNGQQILTCTSTNPNQVVYVCAFAQGGLGGKNEGFTQQPQGGGGGGGQAVNQTLLCPVKVTLYQIGNSNINSTIQSPSISISTLSGFTNILQLIPGGPATDAGNQVGGDGGIGGGAGGNAGSKGNKNFDGTRGTGNNGGTNGYLASFELGSTPITFPDGTELPRTLEDGTVLHLASGGLMGYYSDTGDRYWDGQSGNPAGVMFYYQVPPIS